MSVRDIIVERVRKTREKLISQYGGLEGYFRHLQTLEREHETAEEVRPQIRRRTSRRLKSSQAVARTSKPRKPSGNKG